MMTFYTQEQATEMMQNEFLRIGLRKGQKIGQIQNTDEMCREFGKTQREIVSILSKKFALSREEAYDMIRKYSES